MSNLFVLFCVLAAVSAKLDIVEVEGKIEDAQCLAENTGTVFVRGYQSIGQVDPNLRENVLKLNNAGVPVSAYMLPCFKCGNPRAQVQAMVAEMPIPNRRYFVHIISGQWSTNQEENRAFLTELIAELDSNDNAAGILTSDYHYNKVVGSDFDAFSDHMLFYIHADNEQTCSDFKPFGGWDRARAKKYDFENPLCQLNVDYFWDCAIHTGESVVSTSA